MVDIFNSLCSYSMKTTYSEYTVSTAN